MKSLLSIIFIMGTISAFSFDKAECLKKADLISDIAFEQVSGLPSMILPENRKPGYEMQYGIMLGTMTTNMDAIENAAKQACEDLEHAIQLVKASE